MKKKEDNIDVRTWIEVDREAIGHNYQTFRKILPTNSSLMGVVKSNAYGHGLLEFSKELERLGIGYLGVDSYVEAVHLRESGIQTHILVLGFTLPNFFADAASHNITLTISNFSSLSALRLVKQHIWIDIKIDSGMHRQGFAPQDIPQVLLRLGKMKHVSVGGVYTHFAAAKNPVLAQSVVSQIEEYKKGFIAFTKAGYRPMLHASATSGALLFPQYSFSMVRVGIGIYGLWPSEETRRFCRRTIELKPALAWKSIVTEIKDVRKGEGVGYDFAEILKRNSRIAIVPVGYWHGMSRSLSGIGEVLVRGKRARILGRVCMDMIMVDITDIPRVTFLDVVTLIGKDGKEEISVDELARLSGTSNYEFVTRINPKIKRVYL